MADVDVVRAAITAEGVPSSLTSTRDAIDAVLRDRGLRATRADETTESLLVGAAASAALAGSTSDSADLRAGRGDAVAVGAARLHAELLGIVPVLQRAPAQALARMHVLAARGLVPDDDLGRPVGPDGAAVLRRVSAILLDASLGPALAVASVAHAEVAVFEPFGVGSTMVARALERALLVARGVDPRGVLVPEAGHLELREEYAAALASYAAADVGARGVGGWLLYSGRAWLAALQHGPLSADRP